MCQAKKPLSFATGQRSRKKNATTNKTAPVPLRWFFIYMLSSNFCLLSYLVSERADIRWFSSRISDPKVSLQGLASRPDNPPPGAKGHRCCLSNPQSAATFALPSAASLTPPSILAGSAAGPLDHPESSQRRSWGGSSGWAGYSTVVVPVPEGNSAVNVIRHFQLLLRRGHKLHLNPYPLSQGVCPSVRVRSGPG